MPIATSLVLGDSSDTWSALGFTVDYGRLRIGDVRVRLTGEGGGVLALEAEELVGEEPDGLPLRAPARVPASHDFPDRHANGAIAIDHVVAFTDSLDRTVAAVEACGMDLRRRRDPPEAPLPQAFFNLRTLVLEVGQVPEGPPRFWGLVVVVPDLDAAASAMGGALGTPRDAVQPGRKIATVSRDAGLGCALALMTPRVV